MHVLMTTDTLSGIWTYTRELVSGLAARGARVTLVSFGEIPLPRQTAWMERLSNVDYCPTAFRLDWMDEGQRDLQEASSYLCSLIREVKPSLFHSNHLCYGSVPVSIPRMLVAHGDFVTWWKEVHGREPKGSAWLRRYTAKIAEAISEASALVASTGWMLDMVQSTYSPCRRNAVICHGRNPIHFNPYVTKDNSVLAIGRMLDPAAQIHLLTGHDYSVPVCVAEENRPADPLAPEIQASVRIQDGDRGMQIKGPQTEAQLRQLYSRASIFAATARYEPFGMPVLEAALSRCALILNDIPSLREIWGHAATYFHTNDSESLAEAVRILSEDEQMRHSSARRAFQRARECFNANRMTDNYLQLYRSLVTRCALVA